MTLQQAALELGRIQGQAKPVGGEGAGGQQLQQQQQQLSTRQHSGSSQLGSPLEVQLGSPLGIQFGRQLESQQRAARARWRRVAGRFTHLEEAFLRCRALALPGGRGGNDGNTDNNAPQLCGAPAVQEAGGLCPYPPQQPPPQQQQLLAPPGTVVMRGGVTLPPPDAPGPLTLAAAFDLACSPSSSQPPPCSQQLGCLPEYLSRFGEDLAGFTKFEQLQVRGGGRALGRTWRGSPSLISCR